MGAHDALQLLSFSQLEKVEVDTAGRPRALLFGFREIMIRVRSPNAPYLEVEVYGRPHD